MLSGRVLGHGFHRRDESSHSPCSSFTGEEGLMDKAMHGVQRLAHLGAERSQHGETSYRCGNVPFPSTFSYQKTSSQ